MILQDAARPPVARHDAQARHLIVQPADRRAEDRALRRRRLLHQVRIRIGQGHLEEQILAPGFFG